MTNFLRFLRLLALGAWLGAIVYFASVVTLDAFATLSTEDIAGRLIGFTLSGLHEMGLICAAVFVIASVILMKSLRAFSRPAVLLVILMALLTLAAQAYVMPKMAQLRDEMGSVQATPVNNPRRASFERLHSASVDLEGAVLLAGLIGLFFAVRDDSRALH